MRGLAMILTLCPGGACPPSGASGSSTPFQRRCAPSLAKVLSPQVTGKLIASICHGPWIDISAKVVRGYQYTSTPAIKDDLTNAGAIWVDQPVVVDRTHVSSRRPSDLPQFLKGILSVLAK